MKLKLRRIEFRYNDERKNDVIAIYTENTTDPRYKWTANVYKNGQLVQSWDTRGTPSRTAALRLIKKSFE